VNVRTDVAILAPRCNGRQPRLWSEGSRPGSIGQPLERSAKPTLQTTPRADSG